MTVHPLAGACRFKGEWHGWIRYPSRQRVPSFPPPPSSFLLPLSSFPRRRESTNYPNANRRQTSTGETVAPGILPSHRHACLPNSHSRHTFRHCFENRVPPPVSSFQRKLESRRGGDRQDHHTVAKPRRIAIFIPLCGLRKAMGDSRRGGNPGEAGVVSMALGILHRPASLVGIPLECNRQSARAPLQKSRNCKTNWPANPAAGSMRFQRNPARNQKMQNNNPTKPAAERTEFGVRTNE